VDRKQKRGRRSEKSSVKKVGSYVLEATNLGELMGADNPQV
jgi:hypothetical protein